MVNLYDQQLAAYLRSKANRDREVSPYELVYYLLYLAEPRMISEEAKEAKCIAEDFLARREKVNELADVLKQIRLQKEEAERDALIASLRQLARRQRLRHRLVLTMTVLLMSGFIGLILSLSGDIWPFVFIFYFALLSGIGGVVDKFTRRRQDIEEAKALSRYGGARSVGILAEALTVSDVQIYAAEALIRELPQLKANDAPLLNAEQRKYLYGALMGDNANLILAILKALEQIGDEAAIPYVEQLALGHGSFNYRNIREAAEACLPYLHERAAKQKEHQTLLRASSAADVVTSAPDTLLRPAQYSNPTQPQELLRASIGEE